MIHRNCFNLHIYSMHYFTTRIGTSGFKMIPIDPLTVLTIIVTLFTHRVKNLVGF